MNKKGLIPLITTMIPTLLLTCLVVAPASLSLTLFAVGDQIVPTNIVINSLPNKVTYLTGECFDPTGLAIDVSCSSGYGFTIEYNNETSNKFHYSTEPLPKGTNNVTVTYLGNAEKSFTIPISVDNYRLESADIYENNQGRIIFTIEGEYGDGFQQKVEEAELYLVPYKDLYKFDSVNPLTTPSYIGATYGTFTAEIDITDMYFSDRNEVQTILGKTQYENIFWPHFIMENEQGIKEDKDLKFPSLTMKEIHRTGDPLGETYVLNLFVNAATNKYIPVVARATTNPIPEYTYYYTTSDTTYTFPDEIERGYMPYLVDIENIDDRAIWSITGKFKGFTRKQDLFRCFSFYVYRYPSHTTSSNYYRGIDGKTTNHGLTKDDFVFNLTSVDSGTFIIKMDITDFGLSEENRPGYYTRMSNNITGGSCDCKNADSVNNNKAITIEDKTYTIINVAPNVTATSKNSWGTMGFKITSA